MEHQLPIALQVALYAASIAIVVLAVVLLSSLLRFKRQLERVVTAMESFETEILPLARESRLAIQRLRDLSDKTQDMVGAAGDLLLPPVRAINRTSRLVQTVAATFVQALWNGRPDSQQNERIHYPVRR